MKAIYSSILFKSSPNKGKILAALADPINTELVQQLREYIDEDSLPTSRPNPADIDPDLEHPSDDESPVEDSQASTEHVQKRTSQVHHPSSPVSDPSKSDTSDLDTVDMPQDSVQLDESGEAEEVDESEKSTAVQSAVTACTDFDGLRSDISVIKHTLNTREDSKGVNYILFKQPDELWIYYMDNVNLNSVMGPAIELLNASNFSYLSFNRLARSDNAIVFQLSMLSTSQVEPMSEEDAK